MIQIGGFQLVSSESPLDSIHEGNLAPGRLHIRKMNTEKLKIASIMNANTNIWTHEHNNSIKETTRSMFISPLFKKRSFKYRTFPGASNSLQMLEMWLLVMRLCTLSLNSRRHVVAILSARGEKACFRMRVTLAVILIRSLVNTKHIPGRLRSGSGVALE